MVCPECNGKGYLSEKDEDRVCQECDGQGEYSVHAPFGFDERLADRATLEMALQMACPSF